MYCMHGSSFFKGIEIPPGPSPAACTTPISLCGLWLVHLPAWPWDRTCPWPLGAPRWLPRSPSTQATRRRPTARVISARSSTCRPRWSGGGYSASSSQRSVPPSSCCSRSSWCAFAAAPRPATTTTRRSSTTTGSPSARDLWLPSRLS